MRNFRSLHCPTGVGLLALVRAEGFEILHREGRGQMLFANRVDAGQKLAARLEYLRGEDVVVLGLPRGGVPVALEVAQALDAPLTSSLFASSGCHSNPSWGWAPSARMACGSSTPRSSAWPVSPRKNSLLWSNGSGPSWSGGPGACAARGFLSRSREGRSSWSTMGSPPARPPEPRARSLGRRGSPGGPGCSGGATRLDSRLAGDADEFVCLETPEPFFGVGQFYADFSQTTDEEVVACLEQRASDPGSAAEQPLTRQTTRRYATRRSGTGRSGALGRTPDRARRGRWGCRVRAWQRQQPPQPPEPLCRRRAQ